MSESLSDAVVFIDAHSLISALTVPPFSKAAVFKAFPPASFGGSSCLWLLRLTFRAIHGYSIMDMLNQAY